MEITQVHYFLAICEERNFTRAARRCGVAQPSLTRAIKKLETELGGQLFWRGIDGSELTAFGRKIASRIAAVARAVEEVERLARLRTINGRAFAKSAKSGNIRSARASAQSQPGRI